MLPLAKLCCTSPVISLPCGTGRAAFNDSTTADSYADPIVLRSWSDTQYLHVVSKQKYVSRHLISVFVLFCWPKGSDYAGIVVY